MNDGLYHNLVEITETLEDQREQVRPTDSFSEFEHVRDEAETILMKLEEAQDALRSIIDAEWLRRLTPKQKQERHDKQHYYKLPGIH